MKSKYRTNIKHKCVICGILFSSSNKIHHLTTPRHITFQMLTASERQYQINEDNRKLSSYDLYLVIE